MRQRYACANSGLTSSSGPITSDDNPPRRPPSARTWIRIRFSRCSSRAGIVTYWGALE